MTTRRILLVLATVAGLAGLSSGVSASVIAHYSFDADYTDSSGNANHGTLIDEGTIGNSGITNVAGQSVFGGGAVNFSAERDRVDIPTQIIGSGNPWSVSFWAKQDGGQADGMAIGQADNTVFFIWLNASSGLRWRGADSSTARQHDFTTTKDNAWHHYVLVAEDADDDSSVDDITLYLDGSFVETANDKLTGFIFDDIGEAYSTAINFDFIGQIDEVWILNHSLEAGNVQLLYNTNQPVPEPSALVLAAVGLVAVGGAGYRRRRRGRCGDGLPRPLPAARSPGEAHLGCPSGDARFSRRL